MVKNEGGATRKGTSVVAVDNAVWIEHGHDSEQETPPQRSCNSIVTGKKIDNSMHHPR